MLGNLQGWHLIIILVVILLLFGAPKLPALAKSIGQSMRIFRGEVKQMKDENEEGAAESGRADSATATDVGSGTTDPSSDAKPGA